MAARARISIVLPLIALTVGLAAVQPGGGAAAETGSPAPADGLWGEPVEVTSTRASREASLVLNPVDEDVMLMCGPSGVPSIGNGQSFFHRSTDGGRTWSSLNVETSVTDTRRYAFEGGDCDVAFDAGGTMYTADTWLGNLSVGHSTDGGETWEGTAVAVSSPIVDRPWLAGGPPGTIHVSYQDVQCCTPSAIWYTRSTDSGQTFLPAVPVAAAGPEGTFTWQGNFVVSEDGQDLFLLYTRRQGPTPFDADSSGPESVWVAASHDAGLTWQSHLVARMPNPASYLYPSIAMDAAGNLHAVFASMTEVDRPIWYAFSEDGEDWSDPLPLLRGAAGYSPWVAAGEEGEAAIVWLGSPTPMARPQDEVDWYFYTARVTGAHTGEPEIRAGTTTAEPMSTTDGFMAEFEMVRLDEAGRMHIGMAVYRRSGPNSGSWYFFYQREVAGVVGEGTIPGEGGGGAASFILDVRDDGSTSGTIGIDDPAAGVLLTASSVESLVIEESADGLTCSIAGDAVVIRNGAASTQPFTASCEDTAAGDSFHLQTPFYAAGGPVGGDLRVHP